ncbi:conserved hypothetical protein [Hyphomicrobiales bacterium]|jgi:cytoskeletal protein CcmA (bactofilin family)|nr:conserved hypothetical protein [Hyphomicrobiales bacterium]CAH1702389.1 Polymer-forming cytoskeletal family protein [Hyphomicrobiales bacterium]CAI0346589.1 conserved hypothetical protein [Hyphomicrobiales bacterium]
MLAQSLDTDARDVISQPGTVRLDRPFEGTIKCHRLILEAGAAVSADVQVNLLDMLPGAQLTGPVRAREVRLHRETVLRGEVRSEKITTYGQIIGLCIAGELRGARSATFSGIVVAEFFGSEPGCEIKGGLRAAIGLTAQIERLNRDRENILRSGLLAPADVWATPSDPFVLSDQAAPAVQTAVPPAPLTVVSPQEQPAPVVQSPTVKPSLLDIRRVSLAAVASAAPEQPRPETATVHEFKPRLFP